MKLNILIICIFISNTLFSQEYDTSYVGWSCRVKRISRTEMEVRITGDINRGNTIGLLEPPLLKDKEQVVSRQTNLFFWADSNWHVDAQNTGVNPNRYHSDSWSRKVVKYDSISEARPKYVLVRGEKRQAATTDTNGLHLEYDYITTGVKKSKMYYTTYRVWGAVRIKRTITLVPTLIQLDAAANSKIPAPTLYKESKKEEKKRLKVSKENEKNYKSRVPIDVEVRITYYTGGAERYYIINIPFRGVPLHKWIGVHISELE